MVPRAFVRQYAVSQQIEEPVADQEIVLHYALALLNESGLIRPGEDGESPRPLLFKGGTALRKCVFGSIGRFSQDIDLDATGDSGFESEIETAFADRSPYHGIAFTIPTFRYSEDNNFRARMSTTSSSGRSARSTSGSSAAWPS